MKAILFFSLLILLMVGCQPGQTTGNPVQDQTTVDQKPAKTFSAEAKAVLAKALKAHGGDRYDTAHYQFVFRKKTYTFQNDGSDYRYEVTSEKDGVTTIDVLDNGKLTRTIDGKVAELNEKQRNAATENLNSVIYFATLPHKLTDSSVNIEYGEEVLIKDFKYEILKVTFDQEGGGVDHDDQYRYWINSASGRIDYLAYNYQTNGGGVRFREAYNPRVVDGIVFQDYINYKAPVGTSLDSLPVLLGQGDLEKLSLIETEEVTGLM